MHRRGARANPRQLERRPSPRRGGARLDSHFPRPGAHRACRGRRRAQSRPESRRGASGSFACTRCGWLRHRSIRGSRMKILGEPAGPGTSAATSVAASIRRALAGSGSRRRGRQRERPQRGFIIAALGLWPRDRRGVGSRCVGTRSLEKSGGASRKRRARGRLRICPAIARRCGGARLFLDHRGRAAGCERRRKQ